ncbi:MAG: transcription elongation factor GreA [Oscillospiraceae bacterium]|nr:transcription elongation factor GreA [Oscillospiraceae bacterium]
MEKKRRMSREGFENLKTELEELINVQRVDVAQKLKEARSYGDLSENAEYDEAKNEQALLESRIAELKYIIENAEIVDDDSLNLDEVDIGMVVTLKKIGTDKIEQLKIVGTNEANFREHKISDESPIGKAAMHKKVGDVFIVEAPAGEIEYEILEIARDIQKEV